jgi:hypothetical protein
MSSPNHSIQFTTIDYYLYHFPFHSLDDDDYDDDDDDDYETMSQKCPPLLPSP